MGLALCVVSLIPWHGVIGHRSHAPVIWVAQNHGVSIGVSTTTRITVPPLNGTLERLHHTWWYRPREGFHGMESIGVNSQPCQKSCGFETTRMIEIIIVPPLFLHSQRIVIPFGGSHSLTLDSLVFPRLPAAPIKWSSARVCQNGCGTSLSSNAGEIKVVGRTISFHAAASYSGPVPLLRVQLRDTLGFRATATLRLVVARPTPPTVTSVHHYVALGSTTVFRHVVSTRESVVLDPLKICLTHDPTCSTGTRSLTGWWSLSNGVVRYRALSNARSCIDVVVTDVSQRVSTGRLCAEVPPLPVATPVHVRSSYNALATADPVALVARGRANIAMRRSTLTLDGGVTVLTRPEGTFRAINGRIQFLPAVVFGGKTTSVRFQVANEIGQRAAGTVFFSVGAPPSPVALSTTLPVLPGGRAIQPLVGLPNSLVTATSPQLCLVTTAGCTQSQVSGPATWTLTGQSAVLTVQPSTERGANFSVRYRVTDIVGRRVEGVITAEVVGPAVLMPLMSTVPPRPSTLVLNEPEQSLAPWQRGSWLLCQSSTAQNCVTEITVAGGGTVSVSATGVLAIRPVPGFHGSLGVLWLRASDILGQTASTPIMLSVR
jgi:hypothetical protein